jgi:predicted transcriptional regulator
MPKTLSIHLSPDLMTRLEVLSNLTKRSKSSLAAEAVGAYVDAEEWQLGQIQLGLAELDRGEAVGHKRVSKWLASWGKASTGKPCNSTSHGNS